MAGFRDFQTGEVLTAANVDDFLMKQTVMKFADSAARDTALGTAVGGGNALREGMVAWLDDTDEVIAYDGSAWASVGGGLVAVYETTITSIWASTVLDTWTDVPGMSLSVTPSSSANKIVLMFTASIAAGGDGTGSNAYVVLRVTGGNAANFRGDAAGSRTSGIGDVDYIQGTYDTRSESKPTSFTFVDEPATTSTVTYQLQAINRGNSGADMYLNRAHYDSDVDTSVRAASSIVALEIRG